MNAAFQKRVQKYGWDKASYLYEKAWQEQLKPAQNMVMEIAGLKLGDYVLDVACGTGLVSFRAAQKIIPGGKVTGVDISEKMVMEAQIRSEVKGIYNTNFICMDAEELKFEDSEFDKVICSFGLLYIPDPLRALKEIYRVLKPGGKLVSAVWGEKSRCGWSGIFPVVDNLVKSDVCPLFFFLGTRNALATYYKRAGFKEIETIRINTLLQYSNAQKALTAAFSGGPVALAYSKFSDELKEQAHEEYLATIAEYKNGTGYNIPGEFVVVKGIK